MIKNALIHNCSFSWNYSTERPNFKDRNSISSIKSLSFNRNESNIKSSLIKRKQRPIYLKEQSKRLSNNDNSNDNSCFIKHYSEKQMNPIIFTDKSKLSAFTSFVNDIYNVKDNSSFSHASDSITKNPIHNKQKYPLRLITKPKIRHKSNSLNVSREYITYQQHLHPHPKSKPIDNPKGKLEDKPKHDQSLVQVLKVNRSKHTQSELEKIKRNKKNISFKKSMPNYLILKILDPDDVLEDYTHDKGSVNLFYSRLKNQMRIESVRINKLINSITKANVMNETWLKYYNVKLKNKESKFYQMPIDKPELN